MGDKDQLQMVVVQRLMGGGRTWCYGGPEESTHLTMHKLEGFPEEATLGSCRMSRTWPGRRAGPWVGVGVGGALQRQGCQVIWGILRLHLEVRGA